MTVKNVLINIAIGLLALLLLIILFKPLLYIGVVIVLIAAIASGVYYVKRTN